VVPKRRAVGLRDAPRVFVSPRALFARVENVNSYGWPLIVLLTLVTLVGYATIETGLIDRRVEMAVLAEQAALEKNYDNVVARSEFLKQLEESRKRGEFSRLITRIQVVAARPAAQLARILFIAAILYGAVALTGRKPEWHTLMTICVFASFVDLFADALRLSLMIRHGTMTVDTSAGLLARIIPSGIIEGSTRSLTEKILATIDPFRIWYWLVVLVGLTATMQLKGWRAWLTCGLLGLAAAGVRVGIVAAESFGGAPAA